MPAGKSRKCGSGGEPWFTLLEGPSTRERAGPEHAHATRPHAIRTNAGAQRRHGESTPEHAHATRPHATRNRNTHRRGGPTDPGGVRRGGTPAAQPRSRTRSQQSPANMSLHSSVPPWSARGSLAPCTPLAVRGQPFRPGHGLFRYRENKQCPVSLKQLNQYSGEGARPRGPHPHTAKKGPCGPAKRVEREGPKKRGPDGTEQGAVASGRKALATVGVPCGTNAAACSGGKQPR